MLNALEHIPPAGTLAGEAVRATLVGAAFLLIFLTSELWRVWGRPPAEWTRKLVHAGAALVVASLPWVFAWPATVLALAASFAAILWGTRRLGWLASVHGIARRSDGSLYYVLGSCLLYLLAREQRELYLVAVLVMGLADPAAALVGLAFGRHTYAVETERRSLEGSAAFFGTAWLCTYAPLLFLTRLAPTELALIAAHLALLLTCVEAISPRGSDNLTVPLVAFYALAGLMAQTAGHLGALLAGELALLVLLALLAWRTRVLTTSGVLAAHLFLYVAWAQGGPAWLAAPALALASLLALARLFRPLDGAPRGYQVTAVFYAGVAAALLVLLRDAAAVIPGAPEWLSSAPALYAAYTGILAGQAAILIFAHLESLSWQRGLPPLGLALSAALGCTLVAPLALWLGPGGLAPGRLAVAAAICCGGLALYNAGWQSVRWPRGTAWTMRLQAVSVAASAFVVLSVMG